MGNPRAIKTKKKKTEFLKSTRIVKSFKNETNRDKVKLIFM